MFRTFLLIASPICLILLLANLFDLKPFSNEELVTQKIENVINNNPTASNIESENFTKRVIVYSEDNGLVKEQVVYEESLLSDKEYNELKNELE